LKRKFIETMEEQDSMNSPNTFKVLILGDASVGKTCILIRYCEGTFSDAPQTTISSEFKMKPFTLEGQDFKVQVWDTAGQERFRTITSSFYRAAQGIVVVYDITDKESYVNLPGWVGEIEKYGSTNVAKMIMGNKKDLPEGQRTTSRDEAAEYAKSVNLPYYEVSAKTGEGIDEAFTAFVKDMFSKFAPKPEKKPSAPEPKKKKCILV